MTPDHAAFRASDFPDSVKLTTVLDDTITGAVYAYDPITSTVTVITSPSPDGPGPHDVRILKVSFLKDVQVVGAAANPSRGFAAAEPRIGGQIYQSPRVQSRAPNVAAAEAGPVVARATDGLGVLRGVDCAELEVALEWRRRSIAGEGKSGRWCD